MNLKKYLFFSLFVAFTLSFIVLFSYFSNLTSLYNTTKNEISGLRVITDLTQVNTNLQLLRGYSQFEKNSTYYPEIQKNIKDTHLKLRKTVSLLAPSSHKSALELFLENNRVKYTFSDYDKIIKKTHKEIIHIAKQYELLFEPEQELYFMMSIIVFNIPNIMEDIARVRGLSVSAIDNRNLNMSKENKIGTSFDAYKKEYENMKNFLSYISDGEHFSVLLADLDKANTSFHGQVSLLHSNISTQDSLLFFNNLSTISDSFILLNTQIYEKLSTDLKKRQGNTLVHILLALALILFMFIVAFGYYVLNKNSEKKQKARKTEQFNKNSTVEAMREILHREPTLLGVCEQTTNFFYNAFKANNALLYIHDKTNDELQLGATTAISVYSVPHFIATDEGLIGRCYKSMELIRTILPDDVNINANLIEIHPAELWTIPLVNFNQIVAVLQLSFIQKPALDQEYLALMSEIAAFRIQKIRQEEESLSLLNIINSHVITSSTNKHGVITSASDAFVEISGYSREELIGKQHNILRHPDMSSKVFKDLWTNIKSGNKWQGEVKNLAKDGSYYWVDVTITPSFDLFGNILGYMAVRQDITNKKKIEEISITDALTNIYNRRYFDTMFEHKLEVAKRETKNLVFVLIDIDHFKQYNDTYGHQDGDTALIKVANILNTQLKRPSDFAFRIGGEEFGLLFDANTVTDAITFADSIRLEVEKLHIEHDGNSASPYVTISMGMFFYTPDGSNRDLDEETIYKTADKALYKAKESGRNRLELAK